MIITIRPYVTVDPQTREITSAQGTIRMMAQIKATGYATAIDTNTREEVKVVWDDENKRLTLRE